MKNTLVIPERSEFLQDLFDRLQDALYNGDVSYSEFEDMFNSSVEQNVQLGFPSFHNSKKIVFSDDLVVVYRINYYELAIYLRPLGISYFLELEGEFEDINAELDDEKMDRVIITLDGKRIAVFDEDDIS